MISAAGSIEPLGDRAFLARFLSEAEAARWAEAARAEGWVGVEDVVAAYQTAAVYLDPDVADFKAIETRLRALNAAKISSSSTARKPRIIELPVLYDGPDLAEVARRLGLAADAVVALHSGTTFDVFAIGFLPGFPYAGYLPDALAGLPRRESPRTRVEPGSVALAGRQTGVYPCDSPGGWHLIGRTPLVIVDLEEGWFPIHAGDRLRFVPIDAETFAARRGARL